MKTALIIVDVQYDFLPGGALAIPDGDAIIPIISDLLANHSCARQSSRKLAQLTRTDREYGLL